MAKIGRQHRPLVNEAGRDMMPLPSRFTLLASPVSTVIELVQKAEGLPPRPRDFSRDGDPDLVRLSFASQRRGRTLTTTIRHQPVTLPVGGNHLRNGDRLLPPVGGWHAML